MFKHVRQKKLNLLLSVMVLAWGVIPPGFAHAHVGGDDTSHRHEKCHEVAHHDSHDHDSHHEHNEHAVLPDSSGLSDAIVHLHWQFFGIEFSIPISEKPDDGDDGYVPYATAVTYVIDEAVPAMQSGPSLGKVLPIELDIHSIEVLGDLEAIPHPSDIITSIPLCDSARLERTGVLLA